jgi:hypothetical protein
MIITTLLLPLGHIPFRGQSRDPRELPGVTGPGHGVAGVLQIPFKLVGMHEALEKNFDWIVPKNPFD